MELAEIHRNISEACRILGISRQHYYDIKRTFYSGKKGTKKNGVDTPHIEQAILDYSMDLRLKISIAVSGHPYLNIADALMQKVRV